MAAAEWSYFARIAEIEGFPEIAKALREVAEQHALCAQGTLDLLVRAREPLTGRAMGGTRQNGAVAAQLERANRHEVAEHARTAHNEGFPDIASWFETLAHTRGAHAARLAEVLARLGDGTGE